MCCPQNLCERSAFYVKFNVGDVCHLIVMWQIYAWDWCVRSSSICMCTLYGLCVHCSVYTGVHNMYTVQCLCVCVHATVCMCVHCTVYVWLNLYRKVTESVYITVVCCGVCILSFKQFSSKTCIFAGKSFHLVVRTSFFSLLNNDDD